MDHTKTILKRFKGISDGDFRTQVVNAQKTISLALDEKGIDITPFIIATDIRESKKGELDGTTYNLYMTLITSGGAYVDESSDDYNRFYAEIPSLVEGLKETAADSLPEGEYHSQEAQYLLKRIVKLGS